jgi:hypothetical protein
MDTALNHLRLVAGPQYVPVTCNAVVVRPALPSTATVVVTVALATLGRIAMSGKADTCVAQ